MENAVDDARHGRLDAVHYVAAANGPWSRMAGAEPAELAARLRARADAGEVSVVVVVRAAELPGWVGDSARLCAETGIDRLATEAAWDAAWAEARIEVLDARELGGVDPAVLLDALATDCRVDGVAAGCCGALATPEVLRRAAEGLVGALRRKLYRVRL